MDRKQNLSGRAIPLHLVKNGKQLAGRIFPRQSARRHQRRFAHSLAKSRVAEDPLDGIESYLTGL